jgi:hypothetical protein
VRSADPVTRLLDQATALGPGWPRPEDAEALLNALDLLSDQELIVFDLRSRTWAYGRWPQIPALELVSRSGHAREAAIEVVGLRRGTTALIALRATDWVAEVRHAALMRLAQTPTGALLGVLPLLDALTQNRTRARDLEALVEQRLRDRDLRAATELDDARARRVAWRRLAARGTLKPAEVRERLVHDPDVVVRGIAAAQLDVLPEADRRLVAETLLGDHVGGLAARALEVLVTLDGPAVIVPALTAPSPALRRNARGWAAVRGIDARARYLARLAGDPGDAPALIGLAEIGDPADHDLLRRVLAEDPRARVHAAALRAVARFDRAVALATALEDVGAGRAGRVGRAATAVIREQAGLSDSTAAALERLVLDADRGDGQRLRALVLLRPARWRQLVTLLRARRDAVLPLRAAIDTELDRWLDRSGHLVRGPDPAARQALGALLDGLPPNPRRRLEWILSTTA